MDDSITAIKEVSRVLLVLLLSFNKVSIFNKEFTILNQTSPKAPSRSDIYARSN